MSAPTRTYQPRDDHMSRREEMAVSGSVLSEAPWALAGAAGAVTAVGDMLMHALVWSFAIGGPLSLGAVVFFAVAGAGALLRARRSRAVAWAQRHPWRFAIMPGLACAAVVFVLSMVVHGGLVGSVFTGLWHGAATTGLTGLVGSVGRPRRARA
jgi:hypothetical protein